MYPYSKQLLTHRVEVSIALGEGEEAAIIIVITIIVAGLILFWPMPGGNHGEVTPTTGTPPYTELYSSGIISYEGGAFKAFMNYLEAEYPEIYGLLTKYNYTYDVMMRIINATGPGFNLTLRYDTTGYYNVREITISINAENESVLDSIVGRHASRFIHRIREVLKLARSLPENVFVRFFNRNSTDYNSSGGPIWIRIYPETLEVYNVSVTELHSYVPYPDVFLHPERYFYLYHAPPGTLFLEPSPAFTIRLWYQPYRPLGFPAHFFYMDTLTYVLKSLAMKAGSISNTSWCMTIDEARRLLGDMIHGKVTGPSRFSYAVYNGSIIPIIYISNEWGEHIIRFIVDCAHGKYYLFEAYWNETSNRASFFLKTGSIG